MELTENTIGAIKYLREYADAYGLRGAGVHRNYLSHSALYNRGTPVIIKP